MTKLLVIADDFTGALDSGVQFARKGIQTYVYVETTPNFSSEEIESAEVLVVDLQTRHLSPEQAGSRVYTIAKKAKKAGIRWFYKKTDSALRGNIGAELQGLIEGTEQKSLAFIPAFPRNGRTTVGGKQYIDHVPLSRSVIGQDPFNAVRYDSVSEIIQEQSPLQVTIAQPGEQPAPCGVTVFDAQSDEEIVHIADALRGQEELLLAGCAGFADALPLVFEFERREVCRLPVCDRLLIVSGSLFPACREQFDCFQTQTSSGIYRLSAREKLAENILVDEEFIKSIREFVSNAGETLLLDGVGDKEIIDETNCYAEELGMDMETARNRISTNIGLLAAEYIKEQENAALVVFGGDTLKKTIEALHVRSVEPIAEIEDGVVASLAALDGRKLVIVSKAGAFGTKDVLIRIRSFLLGLERS